MIELGGYIGFHPRAPRCKFGRANFCAGTSLCTPYLGLFNCYMLERKAYGKRQRYGAMQFSVRLF